ncbi:GNAT family N-acetyltransferase [Paraburkholderia sp. BCC1886]|uniref:GNAT family N-acetyltransferase n=1 Tax=Paraburkholderia sp. BCC1886 TaxID=2562670 RepID=UPI001184307D|nr:GNAT family N-acetyltransferase [Paraburkholderia sp. BCC1886]
MRLQSNQRKGNVTVIIRAAGPNDSVAIAVLMHQLGYDISLERIRENLSSSVESASDAVLVACEDDIAVGCVSLHALPLFHMLGSLGRITSFVVDEKHRGRGIGQMLIQAADRWFVSVGCVKAEVTSGDVRIEAHRFYEREGFMRDGQRLSKKI